MPCLARRTVVGRILAAGSLVALASGLSTTARAADGAVEAQQPAATSDASSTGSDIVVTARRRDETVMTTPLSIDVISPQEIKNQRIQNLYDIAAVSPTVHVSRGFGLVGTLLFIRGIGSGDAALYIDQSVGYTIDDIGMSHGIFNRAGSFDIQQIEVLKGPQNLFSGKSTTAGTISVHTADPTPTWETEANVGYEFVADEATANGFVSGPLTDSLGIRAAGYFNDQKGWFYNQNPDPKVDHRLNDQDFGGRITLKFNNSSGLRARLKVTGTHDSGHALAGTLNQGINCPTGVRQNPAFLYDNCKIDQYNQGLPNSLPYNSSIDFLHVFQNGNFADFSRYSPLPDIRDGQPYTRTTTWNASFQLSYDITPALTLTSQTGYSRVTNVDAVFTSFGAAGLPLGLTNYTKASDLSQELRLVSNWENSPVNFTLGALYSPSTIDNRSGLALPSFFVYGITDLREKSRITSLFGQILIKPVDKFEIDLGGRYVRVKKFFDLATNESPLAPSTVGVNQIDLMPKSTTNNVETNFSPEATLLYRPNSNMTIYASYKEGYKGFGFNTSTFAIATFAPTPAQAAAGDYAITPFKGEKVHGFEGGIKASVLDRQLNLTLTPYWYKYTNLQVAFFRFDTNTSIVGNAAAAVTKGMEFGLDFTPRTIPHLSISASAAYNDAKYKNYTTAPCWGGQTKATGCNVDQTTALSGIQDLSGHTLYEAPKWVATLGATYQFDVGRNYQTEVSGHLNYSSSYITAADSLPGSRQGDYATVDASVRFGKLSGPWEIGLIGRNLTNKYYIISGNDAGTVTTGVQGDAFGFVNRGRQVMVQLTLRPGKF
jgi:iron complex outermembrane recepter protein